MIEALVWAAQGVVLLCLVVWGYYIGLLSHEWKREREITKKYQSSLEADYINTAKAPEYRADGGAQLRHEWILAGGNSHAGQIIRQSIEDAVDKSDSPEWKAMLVDLKKIHP